MPQDDRVAAFIAESKNNRNRCYELSEQVTAQVATDSGVFQQYLDIQSRFDRYTANNALLIMAQRPDAQKLGDYGYWRDQNVYVKRMEKKNPVLIMEPGKEYEREDGSIGTYYNAKKLYDISQTNMREKEPVQEAAVLQVDYVKECEKSLSKHLGRGVKIVNGKRKGHFELEFYGQDDLQTLLDALMKIQK